MHYIAVYRREDSADMAGMPVALFRDGALMGNWPKVTEGVHNQEYTTADVELPDGAVYNEAVDSAYEESAAPVAGTGADAAYQQLVAERKAELTRQALSRAADEQARRELQDDGILAPNVAYSGGGYAAGIQREENERGEMIPGTVEFRPDNAEPGTPMGWPSSESTPVESPSSAPVNPERGPAVAPITETSGGIVTDDESPAHRPTPPEQTATVEPE